jgi:small subunit ribosomal protein S17
MSKERGSRKTVVGTVESDKQDKTITVLSKRLRMHQKYGKYIHSTTKYVAHDEKDEAREGDTVEIMETRPLSKQKRWRLVRVVEKKAQ